MGVKAHYTNIPSPQQNLWPSIFLLSGKGFGEDHRPDDGMNTGFGVDSIKLGGGGFEPLSPQIFHVILNPYGPVSLLRTTFGPPLTECEERP